MVTEQQLWERAENPQTLSFNNVYWGQVFIQAHAVVLEKGVGKVDFDEKTHKPDQLRTAIDISLTPLGAMSLKFGVERNLIAESKEWAKITHPSIQALGVRVPELNGKFVRVTLKETGESYINHAGEQKNKTAFVFEHLFVDETACLANYMAASGNTGAAPVQPAAAANPERETALKFLKVLVEGAARGESDLAKIQQKLAPKLAGMPVVNKFFSADSVETLELIAGVMGK